MRPNRVLLAVLGLALTIAPARGASYKIEALDEAPPAELTSPIKTALQEKGYRVLDDKGKPFVDVWLRKSVPASGPPAGAQGAVLFPILAGGELLGALRYHVEGGDYRDQPIAPGAYTLRYGLQPINGDHLGVSTYRDFALLMLPDAETSVAAVSQDQLEELSAEAAQSSHPAVLMLLAPPDPTPESPALSHDEEKDLWGAVLRLPLAVSGGAEPATLPVQLILVGAAMN